MTCSQLANLPCHLGTASVLSFQFQVAGDWTAWLSFLHHHGIQTPHCPQTRLRRLQKSHYVFTVSLVTTVLTWWLKIKEAVTPLGHFMFWAESICNTINDKKKLSKQTCLKINFPYTVITLQNVNENKLHKTSKTEGHLNWNSLDYKTGVIFRVFRANQAPRGRGARNTREERRLPLLRVFGALRSVRACLCSPENAKTITPVLQVRDST